MANLTLIQRLQAAAARSIDEGLRQEGRLEKLLGVEADDVVSEAGPESPEPRSGDAVDGAGDAESADGD